MRLISDNDFRELVKLTPVLERLKEDDLRTFNLVRRCILILRKWQRKQ